SPLSSPLCTAGGVRYLARLDGASGRQGVAGRAAADGMRLSVGVWREVWQDTVSRVAWRRPGGQEAHTAVWAPTWRLWPTTRWPGESCFL
ncbi:unnamed protein product, partial [Urochloa humidicola]